MHSCYVYTSTPWIVVSHTLLRSMIASAMITPTPRLLTAAMRVVVKGEEEASLAMTELDAGLGLSECC